MDVLAMGPALPLVSAGSGVPPAIDDNGGLTNQFLDVQSLRPHLYAADARPASAQALTSLVSRSILAPSKASETGGLASCSRFRTKMLH
jgi:hypothetical protein